MENMDINIEEVVEKITVEVRKCGDIILNARRSDNMVDAKEGHANFVTTYDKRVQDELERRLVRIIPGAAFAGEEGDNFIIPKEGYTFVVDPIDGTTNFIYDYHMSCISVGLVKDGKQCAGVVYNPYLDEMYTAIKGKGAYLNGRRLSVSSTPFERSLALFGTAPYNEELREKSFKIAYALFEKSADVRRSGSAAIDLCAVAAGRANIFVELILSPWDFAAGALMVTEAGGVVSDANGKELILDKKNSMVARGKNMEEIAEQIFKIQ